MKFVQLRAFHNVALSGGFSRAAEALGLTQPAVSDQVLKLEQEYDVLLFLRHKKQVSLTSEGAQLLEITRPLFEAQTRAREFLSETRALTTGNLRIIADSAYHVTGVLNGFRHLYPGVKITLSAGNSEEVEAALTAYKADIGVIGTVPAESYLDSVPLGSTPIIAFAASSYFAGSPVPRSLASLATHPLVLRERGSKTRQKLDAAAARQNLTLTPAIEAEGREAVREIVAAGAGIGFVSDAEYGQDQRLVKIPISGEIIPMEETVICLKQRRNVRMIRAFMAQAREVVRKIPV
ncbi:MAG: LysR family transcriptional regulator [Alphaproteobacteria bacterium]|nr:LysR family transcriptional regulator [Alphaproteobacteria bacterium]